MIFRGPHIKCLKFVCGRGGGGRGRGGGGRWQGEGECMPISLHLAGGICFNEEKIHSLHQILRNICTAKMFKEHSSLTRSLF